MMLMSVPPSKCSLKSIMRRVGLFFSSKDRLQGHSGQVTLAHRLVASHVESTINIGGKT